MSDSLSSNHHDPKLHVANIVEEGKLGGPQNRMVIAAAALKNSVNTLVIMPRENSQRFGMKCDQFEIPYVKLCLTRMTKELFVALRYILFSPLEIIRLTFFFTSHRFDLVHVSGGAWQYKGLLAGKLARQRVLWHLNDTFAPGFIRRIFKLLSPLADGFVFSSTRTKEYYRDLMPNTKPGFVIPAPVDTNHFSPSLEYSQDRDVLTGWNGKLVVGTIALINPIKGINVLIKVASILHHIVHGVHFVVVGPVYKNQRAYYEELIKLCDTYGVTNVEFVGEREDTRALLKRFDIYVCSSYAESSPLAVWEAMSMGKAIVSTRVGDVPLYIRTGESGEIVDVDDAEGIAGRLNSLIADEPRRRQYGKRAREIAVSELDVTMCARRHLEAYQALSRELN